jgi:CheY-like chemotaxis protein
MRVKFLTEPGHIMTEHSKSAGSANALEAHNVRKLRQAKRRGLSLTVNLIIGGLASPVTMENVSASGMGLRDTPDVPRSASVQVQLPCGRVLEAVVRWAGKGRIGLNLLARLENDDPMLQGDKAGAGAQLRPAMPAEVTASVPVQFGGAAKPSGGQSILVGDGFRSICYLIKGILEKAGNTVDFVENGLALVDAARHKTYDLVLIDSHIPLLSGELAAAEIRNLPAPFSQCSIIAISAETLDQRHFRSHGAADAYLAKPIRPARLLEQVAAVRARRDLAQHTEVSQFTDRVANAA